MKTLPITVVRIYVREASHLLGDIVHYLKNEANIRGVSVFRAISGFGESGDRTASWMDLSLDLPIVIEFFDNDERFKPALAHLNDIIKPEHIIFWKAQANG